MVAVADLARRFGLGRGAGIWVLTLGSSAGWRCPSPGRSRTQEPDMLFCLLDGPAVPARGGQLSNSATAVRRCHTSAVYKPWQHRSNLNTANLQTLAHPVSRLTAAVYSSVDLTGPSCRDNQ